MEEKIYGYDESFNKVRVLPYEAFGVKQLLINPDFQVNQRGKSEYNFSTNGKYGLDMWQHRQGEYSGALIVTPIKGGGVHIKLGANSGGGLRQVFKADDFKAGQTYTTVVSIDNVRYTGTIKLSNSGAIIDNDLFQIGFAIADDVVNYSLWIKQNGFEGDINYCNLFEGDIAYPHVKNKYADDLMECMEKVERAKFTVTATGAYFMSGFSYKFPKDSNPNVNILYVANSDKAVNASDFSFSVIDRYLANFIRYKGGSCTSLKDNVYTFDVLLSCEPL